MYALNMFLTHTPTSRLHAKNESAQPGDEKSVGYPFGDVMASISVISAPVSCQLKARAEARSPSAHALLVASHALRPPSSKSEVGRTLAAAPLCRTQRSATSSAVLIDR